MVYGCKAQFSSLICELFAGNGRVGSLALLGHNMMNMLLIENAMARGECDINRLKEYKDRVLAAENKARCMHSILAPDIVSPEELARLSDEQKRIMLDAYVGSAYESELYQATRKVRNVTYSVLSLLDSAGPDPKLEPLSDFLAKSSKKSFRVHLQHLLHSRGYELNSELYIYESSDDSGRDDQPPFIATFALSDELVPFGLPKLGTITSAPCGTKRQAAEEVARKVLDVYHDHPQTLPVYKLLLGRIRKDQIESGRKNLGFYDFEKLVTPRSSKPTVVRKYKKIKR